MPRRHFFQSAQPLQGARLERQRRHVLRPDEADDQHPDAEQRDLDDARPDGAGIHVADRAAELVGQHDQHQRRRDELGDGAGRRDDAHRMARRIAVFQHRRHRDDAHGDDRGGNRAGDGAEDGADEDHRIGQAAAHRAEQLSDRIEQILGEPAALEDRAHEGEERDREQQVVRDDAEQLVGEIAEEVGTDQPKLDADEAEEQAGRRERECRRIADQHEQDHAPEHQGRHVLPNEINHCSGFSYSNSQSMVMDERRDALDELRDALQRHQREADRQQQLDRPADQAAGIRGGLVDVPGIHEPRPGEVDEDHADRQQEQQAAENVDPDARCARRPCRIDQVDPHMLVDLERIGAAQQHHAREHVPLHFEPAVGACAEQIAARCIAGADQAGKQHKPIGELAEPIVHVVDGPAQLEQILHTPSPVQWPVRSGPRNCPVVAPELWPDGSGRQGR